MTRALLPVLSLGPAPLTGWLEAFRLALVRPSRHSDVSRRAQRVILALIAVLLMSLADLGLTITYATSIGMVEKNPVARAVMAWNSPAALAAWKCSTVFVGVAILFALRRYRRAEVGAWVCVAALLALSFHWVEYNQTIMSVLPAAAELAHVNHDPRFVLMPE